MRPYEKARVLALLAEQHPRCVTVTQAHTYVTNGDVKSADLREYLESLVASGEAVAAEHRPRRGRCSTGPPIRAYVASAALMARKSPRPDPPRGPYTPGRAAAGTPTPPGPRKKKGARS